MSGTDDLLAHLNEQALALGAGFFGVADLAPAQELVEAQGGPLLAAFPRAVSIGVAMPSAIVDGLAQSEDRRALMAYRSHGHEVLNRRLDQLASRLASRLQQEGHRAFPIRASVSGQPVADEENLRDLFSHKLAAHLAGLGWIGKSCLLVTPGAGPRVRWVSILTDAPLEPGEPLEERCGGCTACVDACPPRALTGRSSCADEPREARFDVHACNAHMRRRRDETGYRVCGMCVHACPYGRAGSS